MPRLVLGFTSEDGNVFDVAASRTALQQVGPTLNAFLGLDLADLSGLNPPDLSSFRLVEALVDTGASVSCIDRSLAAELALPCIGDNRVSGVSGLAVVPIFLADIRISQLETRFFGRIAGVELEEGNQRHRILLGRDFLRHYQLIYDGRSGLAIIENESTPLTR